ncbi:MAG: hypothetical protein ACKO0W_01275, partial [Planctomycetota bacterium]
MWPLVGCESGMERVDRTTTEKLRQSASQIGGDSIYPEIDSNRYESGSFFPDFPEDVDRPATTNPKASELAFAAMPSTQEDATSITQRFERMAAGPADARKFGFDDALKQAIANSDEYQTAQETYLIAAIRLLIEEHRWGVLPTNVSTASMSSTGDGSRFDNALRLVNELGVSQRLPYGGEVSAAFVVNATEQLDDYLGNG